MSKILFTSEQYITCNLNFEKTKTLFEFENLKITCAGEYFYFNISKIIFSIRWLKMDIEKIITRLVCIKENRRYFEQTDLDCVF